MTALMRQTLTDIALRQLEIPTLETRGRDRLDFHEVSVSSLAEALTAAYEAGQNSAKLAHKLAQLHAITTNKQLKTLIARADDLIAYPQGRSAMVFYAHCPSDGSLRDFIAGLGAADLRRASAAGARWIRFAETSEPEDDFERLLDHFVERFGAPPLANGSA